MEKYKLKTIKVKISQYILLLVFFTLLAVLVIFQFNKIVKEKIASFDQKRQEKIALEERIVNLNKLDQEYQSISADVILVNNLLPKEDELINIISHIEAIAQENKVELSAKFQGEPADHKLQSKFTAKGYFADVMNFYKKLSTSDVLVYIKAIDMVDNNNMLDNIKAEMEMEVYFD